MKKIIIPTLALIALVSSCKVHSHSSRVVDVTNNDIQSLNYTATVSPNFSKRVQGTSNKRHKTESKAKKEAYYNAIVDNSIHVLIDPIYSVSTTKKFLFIFGGTSDATVYGYAGMYKDVKPTADVEAANYQQALKDMKRIGKIKGIIPETQKKSGSDSLITITSKKHSVVDVYQKFKKQ
jgi:hypothetical protein